jgi:hypothetical protein
MEPQTVTCVSTDAATSNWQWTDLVGLIIAFIAVVVSGLTVIFSRRTSKEQAQTAERQRLTASAALLTTVANSYESRDMRERRQKFARRLLRHRDKIDLYDEDSVFDFFEEIGYLVRRGVLDAEMVWNHFFWQLERYYVAVRKPDDLIQKARDKHEFSTLYSEAEWLFKELSSVRKKCTGSTYHRPGDQAVENFLNYESNLIPSPRPKMQF